MTILLLFYLLNKYILPTAKCWNVPCFE